MATAPLEKFISYHAFSEDQKTCAVSKNDDAVYMYDTCGSPAEPANWKQTQVVTEHGGRVSGIDWCSSSNLIVTCGHDRNAYVWKYEEAEKAWKPTLVILRINRAATCVRWSPRGDKFAVGSGAKCVPVCHFEAQQNWWISKMIKKHKSSVLDLAWSPNQKFLVTGSSDFKCRIFSAFIEGIDNQDEDGQSTFGANTYNFGECLMEFDDAKAWVQGVAWSPNGLSVAFVGHGSTLTFASVATYEPAKMKCPAANVQTINQKCLPSNLINFTDDNTLVAIGFDLNPTVYNKSGEWEEGKKLDPETSGGKAEASGAAGKARSMFQDRDTRGVTTGAKVKEEPPITTMHQNCIIDVKLHGNGKFTTSGVDGRILHWSV